MSGMILSLTKAGSGPIPATYLKRNKSPVSLIVSNGEAELENRTLELVKRSRDGEIFILRQTSSIDKNMIPAGYLVSDNIYVNVFVVEQDERKPLSTDVIQFLFQLNIGSTFSVSNDLRISRYTRPASDGLSILFVSPGSIHPLSLGSHQRMFNCLLGLIKDGHNVTVLFQENSPERTTAAKSALRLLATEVQTYSTKRGKLRGFVKWRRVACDLAIQVGLRKKPIAQSFSETIQKRSSFWLQKSLRDVVIRGKYDLLWINYAWMMGKITPEISNHFRSVICDTHDVQFYRTGVSTDPIERVTYPMWYERNKELNALERADIVVAISDRDGKLLSTVLPNKKIVTLKPSFGYAFASVEARSVYKPLVFGFIGTNMKANAEAVAFALDNWWPVIHHYSPDSTLRIAGSISHADSLQHRFHLNEGLVVLGFVDSLNEYYSSIDVLLSPVMMKGGLNFKMIEALVAGKHVFTNENGTEALSGVPVTVIRDSDDLRTNIRRIEADTQVDAIHRRRIQSEALEKFDKIDVRTVIEAARKDTKQ